MTITYYDVSSYSENGLSELITLSYIIYRTRLKLKRKVLLKETWMTLRKTKRLLARLKRVHAMVTSSSYLDEFITLAHIIPRHTNEYINSRVIFRTARRFAAKLEFPHAFLTRADLEERKRLRRILLGHSATQAPLPHDASPHDTEDTTTQESD